MRQDNILVPTIYECFSQMDAASLVKRTAFVVAKLLLLGYDFFYQDGPTAKEM